LKGERNDLTAAKEGGMAAGYGGVANDLYLQDANAGIDERIGKIDAKLGDLRKIRDEILGKDGDGNVAVDFKFNIPDDQSAAIKTAVSEAVNTGVTEGITKAVSSITIDTTAITAAFTQAFAPVQDTAAGSGTGAAVKASSGGPFDAMFQGYAISASDKFAEQFNSRFGDIEWGNTVGGTGQAGDGSSGPFDSIFSGYAIGAATAFQTSFSAAMTGWTPSMGASTPGANNAPDGPQGPSGQAAPSVGQDITITVKADLTPFVTDFNTTIATNFAEGAQWSSITIKVNADPTLYYENINGVVLSLNTLTTTNYFAHVYLDDQISGPLSDIISALNTLPTSKTVTLTTVEQTIRTSTAAGPSPGLATGGFSKNGLTLVGEQGPELAALPYGTHVQSSARTANMLRDAIGSANAPRENSPVTASDAFQSAKQWFVQAGKQGQGDVHINVDNINIAKEVDIDNALARIDRLSGHRMEMIKRGQGGSSLENRTI
jgi:hypothetical protein